jgi:hypothetical protein
MNFKLLLEEMGEKDFYRQSRNKEAYLLSGYGNVVDAHGAIEAIKKFNQVIQQKFPKANFVIGLHGRFGKDARSGTWAFEQQMGGAGHPSNWIPESRGYYCMTNKSVLVFSKDDVGFGKYRQDFEANVLGKITRNL